MNSILSVKKEILRLAIFCVIETIRKDPDKYDPLIYYDDTTNTSSMSASPKAEYYNRQYYHPSSDAYDIFNNCGYNSSRHGTNSIRKISRKLDIV